MRPHDNIKNRLRPVHVQAHKRKIKFSQYKSLFRLIFAIRYHLLASSTLAGFVMCWLRNNTFWNISRCGWWPIAPSRTGSIN